MSFEIISIIIGLAGLIFGLASFSWNCRKSKKDKNENYQKISNLLDEKNQKIYDWDLVDSGIKKISEEGILKEKPDILITFSTTASLVASLVLNKVNSNLPFYCLMVLEEDLKSYNLSEEYWERIPVGKRNIFIPKELYFHKKSKVLFIDDCVHTSHSMFEVCKKLESNGFSRKKLINWALLRFGKPKQNYLGDELNVIYESMNMNCKMPWGKAE